MQIRSSADAKSIDTFFSILKKMQEIDEKLTKEEKLSKFHNGVSIAIFMNANGEYNAYFGIEKYEEFKHGEFISPPIKKFDKILSGTIEEFENTGKDSVFEPIQGVVLKNISKNALHYIVFALNMKQYMQSLRVLGLKVSAFISKIGNPSNLYIANKSVKSDLLEQHLEATSINKHMHLTHGLTEEEINSNYEQSYDDFVKMLEYYVENVPQDPLSSAYKLTYKEFCEMLNPKFMESEEFLRR